MGKKNPPTKAKRMLGTRPMQNLFLQYQPYFWVTHNKYKISRTVLVLFLKQSCPSNPSKQQLLWQSCALNRISWASLQAAQAFPVQFLFLTFVCWTYDSFVEIWWLLLDFVKCFFVHSRYGYKHASVNPPTFLCVIRTKEKQRD